MSTSEIADVAARVLYLGGAYAYLLDRAAESVHDNYVAHVENVFEHDEQPRDYVLDKRLRAETYDKAQDTDTRYQRRRVYAPHAEDREDQGNDGDIFNETAYQVDERPALIQKPGELFQDQPDNAGQT